MQPGFILDSLNNEEKVLTGNDVWRMDKEVIDEKDNTLQEETDLWGNNESRSCNYYYYATYLMYIKVWSDLFSGRKGN